MFTGKHRSIILSGALAGAVLGADCQATELGPLEIHGYGYQGYLLTNRNSYLTADSHGSFNYTDLSVVIAATVDDRTTFWSQISTQTTDNNGAGIDWVFAEYKASDTLTWRAGQIRFPMGFYNETKRAKILHLSTLEPLMYQDLKGEEVIPETFRGASVVYTPAISTGDLSIEAFGGQRFSQDADRTYHNTHGLTVSYRPPVDGLRFMGTGFDSEKADAADTPPVHGRQRGWLMGVDYVNDCLDAKVEYGDSRDPDLNIVTYYAQVGYTFMDKWTPFVRHDYITTNQEFRSDPSYFQKDEVVGIGYRINDYLVLKAEDHILRGYAMPAKRAFGTDTLPGTGATNWNMFITSINFMF